VESPHAPPPLRGVGRSCERRRPCPRVYIYATPPPSKILQTPTLSSPIVSLRRRAPPAQPPPAIRAQPLRFALRGNTLSTPETFSSAPQPPLGPLPALARPVSDFQSVFVLPNFRSPLTFKLSSFLGKTKRGIHPESFSLPFDRRPILSSSI
jgi:hypothetical protein